MDQRASDVETDLKNILQTRLALADKLQLLEQRVEETVQGTKTAALDLITHARNTAVEVVESTTSQLNPSVQAARRPWMLVGGAVILGLLAGWFDQRRKGPSVHASAPPEVDPVEVMPAQGRSGPRDGVYPFYPTTTAPAVTATRRGKKESRTFAQVSSLWGEFAGEFARERDRLQEAALETGRTFLQEMAHIALQSLVDALKRKPSAGVPRVTAGSPRPEEPPQTRPRAAA
jgi:hypothetical protein